MSDLIKSLISPTNPSEPTAIRHASSDESFHSTLSHHQQTKPPAPLADMTSSQVDSANFLASFDVHSYLKNVSSASQVSASKLPSPAKPKAISSTTSYYTSALNQLCQAKGLPTPAFDLQQSGQGNEILFFGNVHIGDHSFGSPERWPNKKGAKEGLSQHAFATIQDLPTRRSVAQSHGASEQGKNWAGLLNHYQQTSRGADTSPPYTMETYSLGSAFSATCSLHRFPDRCFGSAGEPYPSKKLAQTAAAKAAVEFLIEQGELDADGHPIKRKAQTPTTSNAPGLGATTQSIRLTGQNGSMAVEVPGFESYPQRVAEFSTLLGLRAPRYHLSPSSQDTPNLLDGYATFEDSASIGGLGLNGRVGQVERVYGKKNAKDQIARTVWGSLKTVAESRGFVVKDGHDHV